MGVLNVDAIAPGGKKLSGHWTDVNTSAHASNASLRDATIDWDYVVLQDQSQIPGFQRSNSEWTDSKNGSILLAGAIEDEGSQTILMMTWGRRNGDPMNPTLYNNFTTMQDRLEDGYLDYRDNITAAGHTAWIAPVGLAFKHVHDTNMLTLGANVTSPGSTFYDLYSSDGSHPSMAGSYLAACVLYATMTGESPVGSNDTVALNATVKLELQQAAAATVFNETSHLDYPWQTTSTNVSSFSIASRGLGGGIPSGWNVQWMDDEFTNMPAGSSQTATLQISVPSNAAPDYYGFRLYSASTQGNTTSSTLVVVQVDQEHNISYSFLDQANHFIPGRSTNTSIQVTNTGNGEVDYAWQADVASGPCSVMLTTPTSPAVASGQMVSVGLQVSVHEEATETNQCNIQFHGTGTSDSEQHATPMFEFIIDVDERIAFSLVPPISTLEVTPGSPVTYEMRVQNNGSETVTFYLDISSVDGLTTTLTSQSGVSVDAGEVGTWTISTDASSDNSGDFEQMFSITHASQTVNTSVSIEVLTVSELTLSGPLDGRILVKPGQTVVTSFELENTGTANLSLVASLLGLPSEVEATLSHSSLNLALGESQTVNVSLTATSAASSGTHALSLSYGGSGVSATLSLSLQIQERIAVSMSSTESQIVAGPSSAETFEFEVTNLGSSTDTISLSLTDNGASDWFDFELSSTSVSLAAGISSSLMLEVRESSQGAPTNGVSITLTASSSSDASVSATLNLSVESSVAGAALLVLSDDDSAPPAGTIHGTVVVTNTGTGSDQLLLATVGIDCGVSTVLSLDAGASSSAIPWSCVLQDNAEAGLEELRFRVTSSSRSSFSVESVEIYTVEPVWGDSGVVELGYSVSTLTLPSSGSSTVVVTLTNLANARVTGNLSIEGQGVGIGLTSTEWVRLSDNQPTGEFILTPGSSLEFSLTLTSLVSSSDTVVLKTRATYTVGDTTSSEVSEEFSVTVEGPELPPNGVELPFGFKLGESDTLNSMIGGWAFSFLLLAVMYLRRSKKPSLLEEEVETEITESDEPQEIEEETATPLGFNECTMEDGKVTCPSCQARLGVPRGSQPPFRFTCPKCSTMIRVVE